MAVKVEEWDIGDTVVCDACSEDYTNSDATGGILFGSRAICPKCAPQWEESAKRHGEERFIRDRAGPEEAFKAFCLRHRGGNNKIRIEWYSSKGRRAFWSRRARRG